MQLFPQIKSREDFINNPQVQEDYMDYRVEKYAYQVPKLKEYFPTSVKEFTDSDLMAMQHFMGAGNIQIYLGTLEDLLENGVDKKEAEAQAQEALNNAIRIQTKKNPPPNATVKEYLKRFNS